MAHHAVFESCGNYSERLTAIDTLALHCLRTSFGCLSEWLDVHTGVIAQTKGHKPSATAVKRYRVRLLDLLHVHHERCRGVARNVPGR